MTMWSAIRGWFKPTAASEATEINAALVDDMFFSLDDGWMGFYSRSPDGRWVISWRDGHWTESASRRRQFHAGKFLLYDTRNEAVIVERPAPRPQNGHVADNGTFLIEEWGDPSVLGTTLLAFNGAGRQVMKAGPSANVIVLWETLDDAAHAIAAYEEALSLDAKVGVKRKLEALRKVSMGR